MCYDKGCHPIGRPSVFAASISLALLLPAQAWAQFTDPPPENDAQSSMADATLAMCPTLGARRATIERSSDEDDLNDFCDALVSGQYADTNSVLQRVNGEEMQSVQSQAAESRSIQVGHIMSRMAAVRSGDATRQGISVAGLDVKVDNDTLLGFAGDDQLVGDSGALLPDLDWNRLGIFMSGGVRLGDKKETGQSGAFSFDTGGVTVGMDFRAADDLLLGLALGYTQFDVDFETTSESLAGQDLSSEGITLAAFGSYFPWEHFFIDGILSLGWSNYDVKRRILALDNPDDDVDVEDIDGIAKGDFDTFFYAISARAGYETKLIGRVMVTPTLQFDYTMAKIDGFSEQSDDQLVDAISLNFSKQEAESVRSRLGVEARRGFETPAGTVTPTLRAAYIHEYLARDEGVRIRYKSDPTNLSEFELPTEAWDRHFGELGVNLTASDLPYGLSAFVDYATIVGLRDFEIHAVNVGLRKAFGPN